VTADELNEWRALCEWLDTQKYKAAYQSEVPERWRHLVYRGGNKSGERARETRQEAQLIFYWGGWGWRLRKNWRERLAELESSSPEEVARRARAFVRALEAARDAERSAQVFPKDVIIAEMRRREAEAKEKYAALKQALGGS
jgi:hypothetical protein